MIEFLENNLAQIVGFFGLGFVVMAFQVNERSKLIRMQSISLFLYAVHFYLLGAFTGAALDLIGVIRNYVFVKYRRKYSFPLLPFIFAGVFMIAATLTWEGPISILPLIGMIMGTVAFWQENPKNIRLLTLVGPVVWFIYSYLNSSLFGMMAMALIFVSVCVAILRYDILHQPEPSILKDKLKLGD